MLLCTTFWFSSAGLSILLPYVTISSLAFTTWDTGHCQYQRNPGPAQTDGQTVGKPNLEDLFKVYSFFVCIILVCRHTLTFKGLIKFSRTIYNIDVYLMQNQNTYVYILHVSAQTTLKKAQIKFHYVCVYNNFFSFWDGKF